jgi:hypothetical protein
VTTSAFRVVGGVAGISMAAPAHFAPILARQGEPPTTDVQSETSVAPATREAHARPERGERLPAGLLGFWRA